MGTWGTGNFDSDGAADHLSSLTATLVREVTEAMQRPAELEADEYWGVAVPCNLELLALIARRGYVGCVLPNVETVTNWRRTFMATWEASVDALGPSPEHKQQRRAVLERTFDELLACAWKTAD
jgi:hypothetical protein